MRNADFTANSTLVIVNVALRVHQFGPFLVFEREVWSCMNGPTRCPNDSDHQFRP